MFLLKSRDLYRQAFEAFPTDYYTGINAASKSLLAGEKETAAQIAERVQKIVGDTPVVDDYWRTATIAEALLLQGNVEAAAKIYTGRRARRAARFGQPRLDAGPGRVAAVSARRDGRTEGAGYGGVSSGRKDLPVVLQCR